MSAITEIYMATGTTCNCKSLYPKDEITTFLVHHPNCKKHNGVNELALLVERIQNFNKVLSYKHAWVIKTAQMLREEGVAKSDINYNHPKFGEFKLSEILDYYRVGHEIPKKETNAH